VARRPSPRCGSPRPGTSDNSWQTRDALQAFIRTWFYGRPSPIGAAPSLVALGVALTPATAWANHCANFSRGTQNATPWETGRGRWFLIEVEGEGPLWVLGTPDNFMNGKGDALLDGAACPTARLLGQTKGELEFDALSGVWSESCLDRALEGIGG
jgi:hypothetical protein